MATATQPNQEDLFLERYSCKITLKRGDIFDQADVDAIVVPMPHKDDGKDMNYAIFNKIYQRAQRKLQNDLDEYRISAERAVAKIFTENRSQYIVVIPPFLGKPEIARKFLCKTFRSCFQCAIDGKLKKIALPTIGCGVINFPLNDSIECLFKAINELENQVKNLEEIRIVIFNENISTKYIAEFWGIAEKNYGYDKGCISAEMKTKSPTTDSEVRDRHDGNPNGNVKSRPLNPDSKPFILPEGKPKIQHYRYYLNSRRTDLILTLGDITTIAADAIVHGGEVTIETAAGKEYSDALKMHEDKSLEKTIRPGRSRIIPFHRLPGNISYIIRTSIGEFDPNSKEKSLANLKSCYQTSIDLAHLYDLKTISFVPLGCGNAGFPTKAAAEIGIETLGKDSTPFRAVTIVFDQKEILDQWIQVLKRLNVDAAEIPGETVDREGDENNFEPKSRASEKFKDDGCRRPFNEPRGRGQPK